MTLNGKKRRMMKTVGTFVVKFAIGVRPFSTSLENERKKKKEGRKKRRKKGRKGERIKKKRG